MGDFKPLGFGDLIDTENLNRMVQAHFETSGLPVGIIDAQTGQIYAKAGWQRICTEFHRRNPKTNDRCVESDTIISSQLKRGCHYAYKCKNGLWDIGIPIYCLDKHIATIFIGQFLYDDEEADREFFVSQAKEFGFDETSYLAALDEIPIFAKDKVQSMLDYNKAFAEVLSDMVTNREHLENTTRKTL